MLVVAFLSAIDIFGGFLVINEHMFQFSKGLITYFVFYFILKGFWSLGTSVGSGYLFDWLGVVDLLIGIILFLMSKNIQMSFFYIIGWAEIFKGGYCFLRSLLRV
jgi:hypothetical protein